MEYNDTKVWMCVSELEQPKAFVELPRECQPVVLFLFFFFLTKSHRRTKEEEKKTIGWIRVMNSACATLPVCVCVFFSRDQCLSGSSCAERLLNDSIDVKRLR